MKKTLAVLLAAVSLTGCGTLQEVAAPFSAVYDMDKIAELKEFNSNPDKGVLYVVKPHTDAFPMDMAKVKIDGDQHLVGVPGVAGVMRRFEFNEGTYEIEAKYPGKMLFAYPENHKMTFTAKKGEVSIYLWNTTADMRKGKTELTLVTADDIYEIDKSLTEEKNFVIGAYDTVTIK